MTVELADMTNRIKSMTKWMLAATILSLIAAVLSAGIATNEWLHKDRREKIVLIPSPTNTEKTIKLSISY
jgi:hypothetical protein